MRARRIIEGAAFGPDALKVISAAFDAAWADIAHHFGTDPSDIEKGRIRLAEAVLSVAHEDSRDVEVLKRGALEAMALAYRPKTTNQGR